MKSDVLVSVVMSVFNGERFLGEAVESILAQSFADFELIVINDGSSDASGKILDTFRKQDPRVCVYEQENKGLVESLNRGCSLAQGRYIARMDADDIAIPERLALQVGFMEESPTVGVLGGAVQIVNKAGKGLTISRNPSSDHDIRAALLHGSPFWHPTVLMRKDALDKVGGYRKAFVEAEDYDLWLRLAEHYQLRNLDSVLLKYRLHPFQVSVTKRKQQVLSSLAARAAADARIAGRPDPGNSIAIVSFQTLAEMGFSEDDQRAAVANNFVWTIRNMCETGEYLVANQMLTDVTGTLELSKMENRAATDFRLLAARIHWHKKEYFKAVTLFAHALLLRPIILVRPIVSLLRRVRAAGART